MIGEDVSIGPFTEIGPEVSIGDRTRIGTGCFIPKGVTIEEDVFIGPHVCFSNDKYPPSRGKHWMPTIVKRGASIGANSSILPGVTLGRNCRIGMGSVVTKSVPDGALVAGNPARGIR